MGWAGKEGAGGGDYKTLVGSTTSQTWLLLLQIVAALEVRRITPGEGVLRARPMEDQMWRDDVPILPPVHLESNLVAALMETIHAE